MSADFSFPLTLDRARELLRGDPLSAWINIRLEVLERDYVRTVMTIDPKEISANGFLHATVLMGLADITSGLGTALCLPGAKHNFATMEIKTNFMRAVRSGDLICEARPRHVGSTSQVWDAEIFDAKERKTTALFRCTQMVLKNE
jgi:uncharacterized protein (TIGR00369 family)